MRGSQNQTNSASHNLSKQQYSNLVEEIFARLKSLPPPQSPDFNPLRQGSDPFYMKRLEKIDYMCYNGLCP